MFTVLISGSGTGVGKTRVVAALARAAAHHRRSVQIVKPVQTGVVPGEPSDADWAANTAGLPPDCAHTLRRMIATLAPQAASRAEGASQDFRELPNEVLALPPADVRLIEGAGGLAVPMGPDGWDWVEFAMAVHADTVLLVVPDKLGAINQSRLVCHYLKSKYPECPSYSLFLNALTPPRAAVAASTRAALQDCHLPIGGELASGSLQPVLYPPLTDMFV